MNKFTLGISLFFKIIIDLVRYGIDSPPRYKAIFIFFAINSCLQHISFRIFSSYLVLFNVTN